MPEDPPCRILLTGVFTDQCAPSTVGSLVDERINAIMVEDCRAAGTDELHWRELENIDMINCSVRGSANLRQIMRP